MIVLLTNLPSLMFSSILEVSVQYNLLFAGHDIGVEVLRALQQMVIHAMSFILAVKTKSKSAQRVLTPRRRKEVLLNMYHHAPPPYMNPLAYRSNY